MHSMTGFGTGKYSMDDREIVIELKSVNHRFLDVALKLPKVLSFLESDFRNVISNRVSRGHVDLYITYKNTREDAKIVEIDVPLLQQYMVALKKVNDTFNIEQHVNFDHIFKMQGVLNVAEQEDDKDAIKEIALKALNLAFDNLVEMRKVEGQNIYNDLIKRIDVLVELFATIKEVAPSVPKTYAEKLKQRIEEALAGVDYDENRLLTEVAVFTDKCNIDEEIVRFESHIKQLRNTMELDEPIGRKLDFTLQEINREINTIGSKANDAVIGAKVMDIKAELEKIREQIQNIE